MRVPWNNVIYDDKEIAMSIIGSLYREPDLIIAPDGEPYLYRWHVVPRNRDANVYFHLQVDSDPERPLHDHPWDNTSVILSGGYDEVWQPVPWMDAARYPEQAITRRLRKGDAVHRKASEAHRLILPDGFLYTMTLFTTGPVRRKWGFWFPDGWRDADEVLSLDLETRLSVMKEESRG